MNDLELMLLEHWKNNGIKEIYRYKHRIIAFREPLENFILFTDLSCGSMFTEVEDIASHKDSIPEDYKVGVEILINNRLISS